MRGEQQAFLQARIACISHRPQFSQCIYCRFIQYFVFWIGRGFLDIDQETLSLCRGRALFCPRTWKCGLLRSISNLLDIRESPVFSVILTPTKN